LVKLIGGSDERSDVEADAHRDTCCAPSCEAGSIIGGDLPLCENHLITAYRRIGEYLRTKQEEVTQPMLDRQYQPIGIPHGICPKCRALRLGVHLDSGDVACLNGCGYAATGSDWRALVQHWAEARRIETEVVYYLRFGDRVKIGTTTSLTTRLADIPHDEVLATEPGGHQLERQRHRQFEHLQIRMGTHREWFRLTPELAEHIAEPHIPRSA
jgi:hypothetical protein